MKNEYPFSVKYKKKAAKPSGEKLQQFGDFKQIKNIREPQHSTLKEYSANNSNLCSNKQEYGYPSNLYALKGRKFLQKNQESVQNEIKKARNEPCLGQIVAKDKQLLLNKKVLMLEDLPLLLQKNTNLKIFEDAEIDATPPELGLICSPKKTEEEFNVTSSKESPEEQTIIEVRGFPRRKLFLKSYQINDPFQNDAPTIPRKQAEGRESRNSDDYKISMNSLKQGSTISRAHDRGKGFSESNKTNLTNSKDGDEKFGGYKIDDITSFSPKIGPKRATTCDFKERPRKLVVSLMEGPSQEDFQPSVTYIPPVLSEVAKKVYLRNTRKRDWIGSMISSESKKFERKELGTNGLEPDVTKLARSHSNFNFDGSLPYLNSAPHEITDLKRKKGSKGKKSKNLKIFIQPKPSPFNVVKLIKSIDFMEISEGNGLVTRMQTRGRKIKVKLNMSICEGS